MLRTSVPLVILMACAAPDPEPGTDGSPSTTTSTTDTGPGTTPGTTPDTGTPLDTATTGAAPWDEPVDCTALKPIPVDYEELGWAPGNEDFTFGADPYMYSVSGTGLVRTPYGGPPELLVPGVPAARGTRFLPDGRLAIALVDLATIVLVDPDTGSQEVLASGLVNPNGIAIGVDGKVYTATAGQILRIDPDSKDVEVVVDMEGSFDGLVFSPDFRRLYFNEEIGAVHWVDFDDQGNPGPPSEGIHLPIGIFNLLDGMAVDACGNLYVTEMGGIVWRVDTAGNVDIVVEVSNPFAATPAMNFGLPDAGGWERDKLYVSDFLGKLYALDIGVPGKWEPHLPW